MNTSCKFFEHRVIFHFTTFLETYFLFFIYQHWFQGGHSCETHLAGLSACLAIDAIFWDLAKASDKPLHVKLYIRPSHLQHYYYVLIRVKDFAKTRASCNSQFIALPIIFGIPQGSVTAPLLFLVYANDLSKIWLFTKGCVVYQTILNRCRQTLTWSQHGVVLVYHLAASH